MTTVKRTERRSPLRLPDIPRRDPDELTPLRPPASTQERAPPGHAPDCPGCRPRPSASDRRSWIVQDLSSFRERARYPDLLVAFDVDPELYRARNGYVIVEQGKPPDFVLEIASASTGQIDIGAKREDYETFSIREYWRFDETGEFHGDRLAGDRLVGGRYEPIAIMALPDGGLGATARRLTLRFAGTRAGSAGTNRSTADTSRRSRKSERGLMRNVCAPMPSMPLTSVRSGTSASWKPSCADSAATELHHENVEPQTLRPRQVAWHCPTGSHRRPTSVNGLTSARSP